VKQPTEGGSYVYDPKKDDLKQVQKPTEHVGLNDKRTAEAKTLPPTPEQNEASAVKGT